MPTLYTSLRAQHRHKIPVTKHPLPPSELPVSAEQTALEETDSILGHEHKLMIRSITDLPQRTEAGLARKHVVIVGGGLAGLCAAYELMGLQYDVTVYEAQANVGGRVQSFSDFASGKIAEGGGELIGTNHPLWNLYAHKFHLQLVPTKDYGHSQIRFNNTTLSFRETEQLTNELEAELHALSDLAESIVDPFEPWVNPNARHLDSLAIGEWIQHSHCSPICKQALTQMMEADNGIPAAEQSLLGLLAMVKGGGLDRYWTDTELCRCEQGNQKLAESFRKRLDAGQQRVFTNVEVKEFSSDSDTISLRVVNSGGTTLPKTKIDDVILAIPPSIYSRIKFSDEVLTRRLAKAPALGSNVKYLMQLDQRFWKDFGSSPNASEDQPVNLTWETTEDNDDGDGTLVFVAFSGAQAADTCVGWDAKDKKINYIASMLPLYPGLDAHLKNDRFMDWPQNEWTRGSYYFPRRGEVMEWGPFWKTGYGGWLHFAGEHTSYAFVGYMEGALSSGFRLARRLAVRDNLIPA
jgi:monoamine oxidase